MLEYRYLIVGGGMAADAAVKAIRALDNEGGIGLISAESSPPYNRPPLTKGLWQGKDLGTIWRKTAQARATLHLSRQAVALDPARQEVTDDWGEVYAYDRLLLATGGRPRRLPFDTEGHVLYYRTVDDYRRLAEMAGEKRRFAVVGGGFIGSELAASLAMNGHQVTLLFPEAGICAALLPGDLAAFLNDYYREKGVEVQPGTLVSGVERGGDGYVLESRDGRAFRADFVVAGLGIEPNTDLAGQAGLDVDRQTGGGIVVDRSLRTSAPNVYAAGDVAAFYDPLLDRRRRVEHEDNAVTMGRMAGRAMAGEPLIYAHSPFFYSDLFDLGYEAVGDLDARLETVADWQEPYRSGVVYYLQDRRVRGVLLWNVWGQVAAARTLIAEGRSFAPEELRGRLPD